MRRPDSDRHMQAGEVVHLGHGHDIRIVAVALRGREVDQNPLEIDLAGVGQGELTGQIPMIVRVAVRAEQVRRMDHRRGLLLRARPCSAQYLL